MKPNGQDTDLWLGWTEALAYIGRSETALKRAVKAGKVGKKLVPAPGARPRIQLFLEHLGGLLRVDAEFLP
jgi:hypothetical protein